MVWILSTAFGCFVFWQAMKLATEPSRRAHDQAMRRLATTKPGWMTMFQTALKTGGVRAWPYTGPETVLDQQAEFERFLARLGQLGRRPSASQQAILREIAEDTQAIPAADLLFAFVGASDELRTHRDEWAAFAAWGPNAETLASDAKSWRHELRHSPAPAGSKTSPSSAGRLSG